MNNCATVYDVTDIRPPEIFGHDWPLVYFSGLEKSKQGFIMDTLAIDSEASKKSNELVTSRVIKVQKI